MNTIKTRIISIRDSEDSRFRNVKITLPINVFYIDGGSTKPGIKTSIDIELPFLIINRKEYIKYVLFGLDIINKFSWYKVDKTLITDLISNKIEDGIKMIKKHLKSIDIEGVGSVSNRDFNFTVHVSSSKRVLYNSEQYIIPSNFNICVNDPNFRKYKIFKIINS